MSDDLRAQMLADVGRRQRGLYGDEPELVSRLVILRVALNHEFGAAFAPFDKVLAEIETDVIAALDQ